MSNLSDLIPAGGGQNNTDFVADGGITSGKPVILTAAGKAAQVAESSVAVDIPYITTSSSGSVWDATVTKTSYTCMQFDPLVTGRMLVGYNDATGYPSAIVGEQDGSSITWGVSTVLVSVYTSWSVALAFDPANTNQFVAQYYDATATDIEAVSGTITGSGATAAFTLGTAVQLYNGAPVALGPQFVAFDPSASATVLFLYQYAGSPTTKLRAATISSNVITLGTEQDCGSDPNDKPYNSIAFNSAGTFAFCYMENTTNYIQVFTGSISGTTISLSSSATTIVTSTSRDNALCQFDPNNDNKLSFSWQDSSTGYAVGEIVTLSGSGSTATITAGTALTFFSGNIEVGMQCLFNSGTAGEIVFVYQQGAGDTDIAARVATYDDSSTSNTITLGTVYQIWDTSATGYPQVRYPAGCVNGIFGVVFVRDDNADGTVILGKMTTQSTNMTATNLLGVASGAILDTATGTINTWGSRNEVQTGLTIGSDYYVQGDGTITTTSTSPAQLIGTAISATQINIKDYTG